MNINPLYPILEKQGPLKIIQALRDFVTDERKKKIETVINSRLNSIQLAIESPYDFYNAIACVRTCEVLGVSKIHIINPTMDIEYIRPITKGAFYWAEIYYYETWGQFMQNIQDQGIGLVLTGATISAKSTVSEIPLTKPVCLTIGSEKRGLSSEAISSCEILYRIPMYGMTESLNLSVAAGISLYETTQRKRQLLAAEEGDLNEDNKIFLRAQYYLNSVNPRIIDTIFKS